MQLAETDFCLDAGTSPASGVGMKIWQCYDNLPAQTWHFDDQQDQISIADGGTSAEHPELYFKFLAAFSTKAQCLDFTNGNVTNGSQVQTWACTDRDGWQDWTLSGTQRTPLPGSRIHPGTDTAKCLDVRAADLANGTPVQM